MFGIVFFDYFFSLFVINWEKSAVLKQIYYKNLGAFAYRIKFLKNKRKQINYNFKK